jgi:two-component system phosphate regulon sensor histidine kinase PhoR
MFSDTDTFELSSGEAFQKILAGYREPELYVRDHVQKAGESPDITYHLNLRELYLVDVGFEQHVYPDSTIFEGPPAGSLLVGSYTQERNFFRVTYDIYIDFRNRTSLILNEMWLILILSIFTLVLIFSIYYLTLRNMLVQKRLSEMKTDFINNMTHELKTPLSTISVASSALGNRAMIQKKDKVEELSKLIKKQNKHLSELIDRILDINIWEKDQVRLKKQDVNIEDWLNGLAQAFLIEHVNDSEELLLQLNVAGISLEMDEVHMSTAINNLLSNAVKYGHSPCRITLSAKNDEGFIIISVADNGPGIRKEEMKHVFEKFYRGTESKQRVIKGLGLGLFYVKQITEAHAGTIYVNSESGNGTVFIMKIPM